MRGLVAACTACAIGACAPSPDDTVVNPGHASVIPQPASLEFSAGSVVLASDDAIRLDVPGGDADPALLDWFLRHSRRAFDVDFALQAADARVTIRIDGEAFDASVLPAAADAASPEAYTLVVDDGRVDIRARAAAGAFYALTTLWQLADADEGGMRVPEVRIADAPRFRWRGVMLDSARHFQSRAFIERLIDAMALHKLNVLHWHLSDDQGWRLEIERYPRLTAVGGSRRPATVAAHAAAEGAPYRGWYSQDDVRAIVAHAASRGITVVPEIDLPGHVTAALVAYPELAASENPPKLVPADWGIYDNVLNLEDDTLEFFRNVLSEVVTLFPSPFVHLGGDEVEQAQWRESPRVRARMEELGLETFDDVQNWHFRELAAFLAEHGKRAVGWDEIVEGEIPGDAVVMSWRGIDGGVAAARAGHEVVLAPAPTMYLDHLQTPAADAPPGRGGVIAPRDILGFDPLPAALAAHRDAVLGVQVNLWTEHVQNDSRAGYMLFPRAAALAELGWSPAEVTSIAGFERRLPRLLRRYAGFGLTASDDLYAARLRARPAGPGRAVVHAVRDTDVGEARYTLDGSTPTPDSPKLDAPLEIALPATVAVQVFVDGEALGALRRYPFDARSVRRYEDRELETCDGSIELALEDDAPADGTRESFLVDIMNPCWILRDVNLEGIGGLRAAVGQVPFNFRIGDAVDNVVVHRDDENPAALVLRAGGCSGPRLVALPTAPAAEIAGVTVLPAAVFESLPPPGPVDLCLYFTRAAIEPIPVIDWIEFVPAGAAP